MIRKRFLWSFLAVMAIAAAGAGVSSCGNDDDEFVDLFRSENIESIDFDISPWYYPTTGSMKGTPVVRLKSGTPVINEVEYYIDGKSVYKSGNWPFGISYPLDGVSVGDHTLKAVIKYGEGKILTLDGCYFAVYDEEEGFEGCRVRPLSRTIENGQTLYCDYAYIPRKSNETTTWKFNSVKFLWDDEVIQKHTSAVCTFSFPIINQSQGKHKLSVQSMIDIHSVLPGNIVVLQGTKNFDYDVTVSK